MLKKVKGRWAIISKSKPKKVLKWFDKKPTREEFSREESRIQYFKNLSKNMGSGWFNDSSRHSKAAKGVKTKNYKADFFDDMRKEADNFKAFEDEYERQRRRDLIQKRRKIAQALGISEEEVSRKFIETELLNDKIRDIRVLTKGTDPFTREKVVEDLSLRLNLPRETIRMIASDRDTDFPEKNFSSKFMNKKDLNKLVERREKEGIIPVPINDGVMFYNPKTRDTKDIFEAKKKK